jgi:hypothetical protein
METPSWNRNRVGQLMAIAAAILVSYQAAPAPTNQRQLTSRPIGNDYIGPYAWWPAPGAR